MRRGFLLVVYLIVLALLAADAFAAYSILIEGSW
jgi:hypothetical protein